MSALPVEPLPRRRAAPGRSERARMRIVVHDYAGHPFQVQLSRELAARGHDVLHLYCASVTTGQGDLQRRVNDPDTLDIEPILLSSTFERYAPSKRLRQEISYGKAASRRALEFEPDVVLSSNTPLLAQRLLVNGCRRRGVAAVFWHQDVLGLGIKRVLSRRNALVGAMVGGAFVALERAALRRSDAVVAVSDDFVPVLAGWGIPSDRVHVIENWAPIDELPLVRRDNAWAVEQGLVGRTVVLYSGTLGLKHNPELLLALARRHRDNDDVAVVVVSEGLGASFLQEAAEREELSNLRVLPFQPYDRLPEVLASADVLVAILEADAGAFSVPSKVLSYLCAGRAILGALPASNLAARTLARSNAGLVVEPRDVEGFVDAGTRLIDDRTERERCGRAGRRAAEHAFDVDAITNRFESVLSAASHIPPNMQESL